MPYWNDERIRYEVEGWQLRCVEEEIPVVQDLMRKMRNDYEHHIAAQAMPDEVLRAIHDLVEHTFWFERLPVVREWLEQQPKQQEEK